MLLIASLVKEETGKRGIEYGIMLYGSKSKNGYSFEYAECVQGESKSVTYNQSQKDMTRHVLSVKNGEVVYGHTHVAVGNVYNSFSLTDLKFFVEIALKNRRNVFAMLITKDRYTMVMYSYKEKEFFRIQC